MTKQRKSDYPIHEMFLNRWSPRAFTGEPITQEELLTMLEAARWAASSYNSQPWRFLYALRERPHGSASLTFLCRSTNLGRKMRPHWSFSYRTRPCDPLERKRSPVPDTLIRCWRRFRLLRTPSFADGLVRARHDWI